MFILAQRLSEFPARKSGGSGENPAPNVSNKEIGVQGIDKRAEIGGGVVYEVPHSIDSIPASANRMAS